MDFKLAREILWFGATRYWVGTPVDDRLVNDRLAARKGRGGLFGSDGPKSPPKSRESQDYYTSGQRMIWMYVSSTIN